MIKCTSVKAQEFIGMNNGSKVRCTLVADTTEEVVAIGADASTVVGLGADMTMDIGSICMVATGEVGMLNSSGVWTF